MSVCVHAHWPGHAAMGRRGPLARGPYLIELFSKSARTLKFKMKVFVMSNNTKILQVDSLKHREQVYFLDQLQNPSGFQVTNSRTN
jgi:hypothetical protein